MIATGDVARAALWVTGREKGDLVSDPALSRWGISLKYHPALGEAGIRAMTQDKAAAMFGETTENGGYWDTQWNALPSYLAIPLLSFAVLEGPVQASRALQRALVVKVDGDVGPGTLAAAASAKPDELLEAFFGACMQRFQDSSRWTLDGVGWCRRQGAAWVAASIAAKSLQAS